MANGMKPIPPVPPFTVEEKKLMDEIPLTDKPLKLGPQPAPGVKSMSPELTAFLKDLAVKDA